MLSERDQSETNNALRVLFRYCYTTRVRSQILAPRLNPSFYFISLLSFFLSLLRKKKRSLLVPLGGCWGWGGSAQRTMGKEKEGELLPFLPSSLTHFFFLGGGGWLFPFYIWNASASFCLWSCVLHHCICIRNKREWCKKKPWHDQKWIGKTECLNSKLTKSVNMRRSLLEWFLLSKLIQNSVD